MEFYQPDDGRVAQALGLAPIGRNRRGARYGFPVKHSGEYLKSLLALGRPVVLVYETERNLRWVRERGPRWRFESRQLPESRAKAI